MRSILELTRRLKLRHVVFLLLLFSGAIPLAISNGLLIRQNRDLLETQEKSSLTAKYESDLADLLESSGSVVLAANHDSVFLALAREGKVVRFDGATGARAQTYALEAGAGLALAVGRDKFYVNRNQAGWDVIEVDIRSGQTTRTYANLQPAWLALESSRCSRSARRRPLRSAAT